MINPKSLDELTEKIQSLLPPGMDRLQQDLKSNVSALLSASLSRMDLVTREEFDVQSAVLARTRAKLDALEAQVAKLEDELLSKRPGTD